MLADLLNSKWFSLIYLLVLIGMVVAGVLLSHKLRAAETTDGKSLGLLGYIISFFSLLLAFTLSSSSDSNKARISFMQQHRGAIASLYRQSYLFDDSLRHSVKEYTIKALELKLAEANAPIQSSTQLYRKALLYNNTYLRSMQTFVRNNPQSDLGARSVIDEVEKIIDLGSQVHFSNQKRTPTAVMVLLLLSSWAIGFLMGLSGYLFRQRYYLGPIIFTSLTSLTVLIIQDMDNPHRGFVRPPYSLYQDLLEEIQASE